MHQDALELLEQGQRFKSLGATLGMAAYGLHNQAVASVSLMLLEPAVQHIGVHPVLPCQCRDGHARLVASCHQFGFELGRVGPVGATG